ncbi:MAG: glycerol-3-phosphate 1-O-acyltransferase PlsY [Streptococcus sp.]|nr:glycerol-3-phosphate 1-O-acyltransferase PlsY [Streptococcus sp.]
MKIVILILIAYLLGSIPSGLWIGQYFYKINLREHGSGNTGTTNTFRIIGPKAGIITFLLDFLKGLFATLLPILLGVSTVSPLVIGFFAIIGHTFPIFAHFKGGKAVATTAGVLIAFAPFYLLFLLGLFIIILYLFSMISFASVCVAVIALISLAIFPACHFLIQSYDLLFTIMITLMATMIIFRHKDNINRISNQNENLVPWGLNLLRQKTKK